MKLKKIETLEQGIELHESGELLGRFDLPNWMYHALPGVSSTDARNVLRTKNKFLWNKNNERKQTPEMVFGSLLHLFVLQPDRFDGEVMLAPDVKRQKNIDKETWAIAEEHAKKNHLTLVKSDQIDAAKKLAEITLELASGYFKPNGRFEESLFWFEEIAGQKILCKIRPDYYNYDDALCLDIKTCDNAGDGFLKSVENFRYDIQDSWYRRGLQAVLPVPGTWDFLFLAQEKSEDCDNRIWRLSEQSYEKSDARVLQALQMFAEIENYGVYGGYSRDIGVLNTRVWVE